MLAIDAKIIAAWLDSLGVLANRMIVQFSEWIFLIEKRGIILKSPFPLYSSLLIDPDRQSPQPMARLSARENGKLGQEA